MRLSTFASGSGSLRLRFKLALQRPRFHIRTVQHIQVLSTGSAAVFVEDGRRHRQRDEGRANLLLGQVGNPDAAPSTHAHSCGEGHPGEENDNPTNEEVEAKLKEFIDAMETLFMKHRGRHGFGKTQLVIS